MSDPAREYPSRVLIQMPVMSVLAILALMLPLIAQAGGGANKPVYGRQDQQEGDTRISLRVKNQPLQDVLKYIQEQSGINIVLANNIDQKVTLDLNRVPWRLALGIVAEKAGCVLVQKATNLIRVEQPPRVTFDFSGSDIKTVIDSIAKIAGTSVVIAPQVEGKVFLRLNDVPWLEALKTVAKSLGFVVVEESWGIYRVVSPETLETQMVTEVFTIKYLRPSPRYQPKISTQYADDRGGKTAGGDPEKNFTLIAALKSALSDKGKLSYHARENLIIVKDIPPVIDEIGKILSQIDVEPGQVFIDVKFVTTSNTNALRYGVDIGEEGLAVSLSGGSIPSRLPFSLGSGGPFNSIIASKPNHTPGLSGTDLADRITFGTLDFTKATFTLNLLKRDLNSRVIQAPKLMALDNQEATIFVGRTIRYAETTAEAAQSGGLRFSIKEAQNSPVQTGFQLFMVPHIVPGTNKIMMTVIPEAEQLVGPSTDPNLAGFQVFTSGEGATAVSIALPQIASTTLVSTLLLESGQTAVIGGLISETETNTENKIPLLGDIPLLGFLFKSEKKAKEVESLFIFISPRIVRDSEAYQEILRQADKQRQAAIEGEMKNIFGEGGQDSKK